MTHETLKLAIQYLVETKVISSDRFNAIYLWMQKRLFKQNGFGSVTYELSDTQKITVTRDTITYCYSVEIITLKPLPTVTQPTELKPTVANAVPLQLSIFDHLEVDADKALQYFRTHKKVRRLKLVVDNTPTPQLPLDFSFAGSHTQIFQLPSVLTIDNVNFDSVRQRIETIGLFKDDICATCHLKTECMDCCAKCSKDYCTGCKQVCAFELYGKYWREAHGVSIYGESNKPERYSDGRKLFRGKYVLSHCLTWLDTVERGRISNSISEGYFGCECPENGPLILEHYLKTVTMTTAPPANNVVVLQSVREKRQPKVQHYDWGWQYLFDKTGF